MPTNMPINPQIFREYDIRGHAERDFDDSQVRQLTHAIITYFQQHRKSKMIVGHDCRLSSPRIVAAVLEVAAERGMAVIDIGQVTTPAFYFAAKHLGVDAGLIITASHNPPPDNGMKVLLGPSTIHGAEIQKIREIAASHQPPAASEGPPAASCQPPGPTVNSQQSTTPHQPPAASYQPPGPTVNSQQSTTLQISPAYIQMLVEKIKLGPRRLKVVVDCGNGTAGPLTAGFLDALGIEYTPLFFEPDGNFPNHEADPTKTKNMQDLRDKVLEIGADLGIGFDGDGDRIGVVDDLGNMVWGDKLMALFWREILPKYLGTTCLVEVKCSQALVDEILRLGGKPEFTKTGHSLIKARMRELGAVFTGEMSGHIFFADEYYGFDDALYAAGRLLRLLSNSEQTLSQMLATLPQYHSTAETRITCPDTQKFDVVRALTAALSELYPTVTVDGVRVEFPHGWGLFRASNTGPVIVTRCEARTPELLAQYCRLLETVLIQVAPELRLTWEH